MINLSTGFANALADNMGLQEIIDNMVIEIRSGSQNATTPTANGADMADTGTLLWKASVSSGAITEETLATATVDLTGASANPTGFTVGGHTPIKLAALPTFTTAAALAASVVAAINASTFALGFKATLSGSSVIVTAPKNTGAYINTTPMVFTAAGLAGGALSTTFAGGVTALNKLSAPTPVGGVITYDPLAQTWSGLGLVDGTPQHFRIKCSGSADTGGASTSHMRIDGSIAQIGGDMRVSTANVVVGKLQTVDEFSITIPQ